LFGAAAFVTELRGKIIPVECTSQEAAMKHKRTTTKTILVVEDEVTVLKLLTCYLGQYNIIEATTAEDALRLFIDNNCHIDLLLADVRLPRSSGIQVALFVRSKIPSVPVILTSGYCMDDLSALAYADLKRLVLTSVVIFQKPFQIELLLQTIRGLIGSPKMAGTAFLKTSSATSL